MLPQVAEALEELGWVSTSDFVLPDEVPPTLSLVEGAACQITINAYERNPEARRQCIKFYGATCFICRFNFGAAYGPDAEGYIHVHHLKPLSEVGGEYVIDPVKDLRPVCPNCHGVLHLGGKYRTIDEVSQLMLQQKHMRKLMDGYGDYTAERDTLIGSMTQDEILSRIKSRTEAGKAPPRGA
jgi:putative restriction endonuclease